jgi:FkbM family methyltransferase
MTLAATPIWSSPIRLVHAVYHTVGVARLRHQLFAWRYHSRKTFTAGISGHTVVFQTQDLYSKRWFYPRYCDGRIHEEVTSHLIMKLLRGKRCFLEVGANLGWFACLAGRVLGDGRVVAFEMDEQNFRLLQDNVATNRLHNVVTVQAAVADNNGVARYLRTTPYSRAGYHLLLDSKPERGDIVETRTITLDSYAQRNSVRPDVVKIDVEGAEVQVLRGMRTMLKRDAPSLVVEVHPERMAELETSSADLVMLLQSSGYKVAEITNARQQGTEATLRPLAPGEGLEHHTTVFAERPTDVAAQETESTQYGRGKQ